MTENEEGYIYIIGPAAKQPSFIGTYLVYPTNKLMLMQETNWEPLSIWLATRVKHPVYMAQIARAFFKPHHIRNDWYDVPAIIMVEVLRQAKKMLAIHPIVPGFSVSLSALAEIIRQDLRTKQ